MVLESRCVKKLEIVACLLLCEDGVLEEDISSMARRSLGRHRGREGAANREKDSLERSEGVEFIKVCCWFFEKSLKGRWSSKLADPYA